MRSGIDAYAEAWEFVTARHAGQTYGGRGQGDEAQVILDAFGTANENLAHRLAAKIAAYPVDDEPVP